MKKLLLLLALVTLFACVKKEEPKKDDFLNPETVETPSRIKILEGGSFKYFWIVEVDGHQYLCNANNGGIVHLESCPCKTK
jgi:hypothetical protein